MFPECFYYFAAFSSIWVFCNSGFINEPCSSRNTLYMNETTTEIPPTTQCIDLYELNNTKLIEERIFLERFDKKTVDKIQTILAETIGLTKIPKVEKFTGLQQFHLSENKVRYVPPLAFKRNPKLILLVLKKNQIRRFNPKYGLLKSASLKTLVLSFNELRYISKDTFKHLPNLSALLLDGNKIKEIADNAFTHLGKLNYLRLTHNPFTYLSIFVREDINLLTNIENVPPR